MDAFAARFDPAQTSAAEFLDTLDGWPGDLASEAIAVRCQRDVGLFCVAYFPDRFGQSFNELHRDFLTRPKTKWTRRRRPRRWADAAPRGFAKSTIVSYAHVVHDIVYGFESYVGMISTTRDLSDKLVEDIFDTFNSPEAYPDLHRDFGPFKVRGTKTDFVVFVPGQDRRGVRIKAFSFGTTIRGEKHAGIRPTKIVIDDGEHPEKTRTSVQRAKTWEFLTKDILPAGDDHTIVWVVGTLLPAEAMLARLLETSGWTAKLWRAIIEWPKADQLWNQCRDLWRDLYSENREQAAIDFYTEHQAEMDEGAQVLWPSKRPIFYLMTELWSLGRSAFASEYQNDPLDPTNLVFDPRSFRLCKYAGLSVWHLDHKGQRTHKIARSDMKVAIWLDPAGGKRGGDYACTAVVAADRRGYRYVLECHLVREPPSEQRARMWQLFEHYGPTALYGSETNKWSNLFSSDTFQAEKQRRRREGLPHSLHVGGYHVQQNKETRIRNIQPPAAEGALFFSDNLPAEMHRQFRDFPRADHDDAPDAIERAYWLLDEGEVPVVKGGTPW